MFEGFLLSAVVEVGEENLRGGLVQLAGESHHQQWPGIAEHPATDVLVEGKASRSPFLPQHQQCGNGTEQVDIEDEGHVERELFVVDAEGVQPECGQHNQIEDVQRDVQQDIDNLQHGKLNGLVLIAQVGKRDGHKGIDGHRDIHHRHVLWMISIAYCRCYRLKESQHQQRRDEGGEGYHRQCRRIDLLRILTLLAHKAEEGGLHAEGQQDD